MQANVFRRDNEVYWYKCSEPLCYEMIHLFGYYVYYMPFSCLAIHNHENTRAHAKQNTKPRTYTRPRIYIYTLKNTYKFDVNCMLTVSIMGLHVIAMYGEQDLAILPTGIASDHPEVWYNAKTGVCVQNYITQWGMLVFGDIMSSPDAISSCNNPEIMQSHS